MGDTERYFLKKTDRLKSRKAIELIFTNGKSFSNFPFRTSWMRTNFETGVKAAFTASTKNFKNATDRNKIKRLMREAYRLQKNDLQKHASLEQQGLHIFFIYTSKDVPAYDLIFEKIGAILRRLVKLLDEAPLA